MDFTLPETTRMIQDTVRNFTQRELIPHEPLIIRREAERGMGAVSYTHLTLPTKA